MMTTARTLPVLMYHSVGVGASRAFRRWQVEPKLLAEQLAALAGAGYTLTGLTEALDRVAPTGRPVVAVTFDDGFRDFTRAAEILHGGGATATLYVPTAHVGGAATWLAGYAEAELRLLDWGALAELAGSGIEVGSHGHEHAELDVVGRDTMRADVAISRAAIADELGQAPASFCYPFGYHTAAVRAAVAAAGYRNATEVGYRLHDLAGDRFAVSRLIVTGDTSPEELLTMVRTGQDGLAPALRRRTRTAWRAYRVVRHTLTREAA